jgi:hypothetical protein
MLGAVKCNHLGFPLVRTRCLREAGQEAGLHANLDMPSFTPSRPDGGDLRREARPMGGTLASLSALHFRCMSEMLIRL